MGFEVGGACGKNGYRGAPSQTNKGKRGGHDTKRYFRNTLKWPVLILKETCYRIYIVERTQIYCKLSLCFKITFDGKICL